MRPIAPYNAVSHPHVETDFESGDSTRAAYPDAIWSCFREQLLTRPKYVALMCGIEQLAYLSELPKPTPSPTLVDVGNLYFELAKISADWLSKSKQFWREFTDLMEVKTLRDITQEHIIEYADVVREAAKTGTYARQRFGAIKTIINFPPKRGKWAEDSKRALALCAALVPPRKSGVNPKPISREEFHKLYSGADNSMKAMLLLALNACCYGGEVASLKWSDLDLNKGTLVTARSKTNVVRIATLWPRTVAALLRLERRTDSVFLTEAGTQANYLTVYRTFKSTRTAVDLTAVQFSQIRDGSYTAAVEAGVDLNTCRLLAGHATGISDHYVRRGPKMVAAACAAIEKAYFV